jgi:hypothetical protein
VRRYPNIQTDRCGNFNFVCQRHLVILASRNISVNSKFDIVNDFVARLKVIMAADASSTGAREQRE